ncbi:SHOCT domain-containing protein [Ornithinimicrobium sp. F0845]|uniref:SHOCT domain-containing protein n=1 Tax=Ornithinimicrobium sp. F0845 TaxID=2926412 RepID=UPI0032B176A3
MSDNVARRQQNRAEEKRAEEKYVQHEDPVQQQAAGMAATPTPVPAAAAAPAPDMVTQLQQLADLKAQGVLTEVEFENAKAKLLNRL